MPNSLIKEPRGIKSDNAKLVVISSLLVSAFISSSPKNLASGLTANAKTEGDQVVNVVVKGVQSVIDSLTADDIVAYVDLSGYTAGEHEVAVQIENNDPRIEYVVTKNITIVIK